ncbi:DNA glycosylase [Sporormia fimetaria CBS 119925]|uniref:Endonuclease III homolog n=1 Tax=Sporormia fimetaria CBS 119925 TaxID=1340428 RepID=A0A6A6VG37_9PLEO|nr:DNA glycosylase [Sporormia fimetaria CBS 119925]
MRTSRVSRDAARVASALAAAHGSRPPRQTRQTARSLNRDPIPNAPETDQVARQTPTESQQWKASRPNDTESELSSAPESSDYEPEDGPKSRKRKRGAQTSGDVLIKREAEEIILNKIASPKKVKKARRTPAKKSVAANGSVKVEPPPNWEEIYALTREMRNAHVAPVDTMGCESLADRQTSLRDQRFQTLVSLMLSSQTKDTVTSAAIKDMQANMPGGFNLESVLAIEPPALNAFICKVGFHNLKTKYIKAAAEILRDKYNSDIPDTIEGLTSLPGVGPKMAYLCMSAAWGRDEGIGVDVHVHRITNLWGWHKTKQPEETRHALESWLPKDRWHDINNLLVGFGQTICLPVGRKCGDCKLAERGLCPSAVVSRTTKLKKETDVVKSDSLDGSTVKYETATVVERSEVKAEDMETSPDIADIEDIGVKPRKRAMRIRRPV